MPYIMKLFVGFSFCFALFSSKVLCSISNFSLNNFKSSPSFIHPYPYSLIVLFLYPFFSPFWSFHSFSQFSPFPPLFLLIHVFLIPLYLLLNFPTFFKGKRFAHLTHPWPISPTPSYPTGAKIFKKMFRCTPPHCRRPTRNEVCSDYDYRSLLQNLHVDGKLHPQGKDFLRTTGLY